MELFSAVSHQLLLLRHCTMLRRIFFAHGSDEADGTRWSMMSTQLPPETLRVQWLIWVFIAWVSAAASFLVIIVIARRPRLRSQPFNFQLACRRFGHPRFHLLLVLGCHVSS